MGRMGQDRAAVGPSGSHAAIARSPDGATCLRARDCDAATSCSDRALTFAAKARGASSAYATTPRSGSAGRSVASRATRAQGLLLGGAQRPADPDDSHRFPSPTRRSKTCPTDVTSGESTTVGLSRLPRRSRRSRLSRLSRLSGLSRLSPGSLPGSPRTVSPIADIRGPALDALAAAPEPSHLRAIFEIGYASLPRDFGGIGTNRDTRF